MRTSDALTLPMTTFATLLTVVACGPTKDYVPVKLLPGTPIGQAFQKCAEEIRPSKARVITSSVSICEDKDGLYAMVPHTFRYGVETNGGQIHLKLKPGIDYSTEVPEATQKQVRYVINEICTPLIKNVFKRTLQKDGVKLAFDLSIDSSPSSDSPMLEFLTKTEAPQKAFALKGWPDREQLFPAGLKVDMDKCEKIANKASKDQCRLTALRAANAPFCVQLARLTGHWLGLKVPKGSDPHCKETSKDPAVTNAAAAAASNPPPKPRPETDSPYMKGAYEMDAKDFFEKAALSRNDIKSVFAPACSSFRSLPEEATAVVRAR